jgi:AraC family transcriptional activator of pobA
MIGQQSKSKRHVEITLAFKELLSSEKQINRNISHYAESLHISPVYLNEVVKSITGVSVSRYIQNELILQAKRMLAYTSLTIREISNSLGIEDYAYFTRLFTKAVGVSPTCYRKKYLE